MSASDPDSTVPKVVGDGGRDLEGTPLTIGTSVFVDLSAKNPLRNTGVNRTEENVFLDTGKLLERIEDLTVENGELNRKLRTKDAVANKLAQVEAINRALEDERDVHTLEKNHFKEEAERQSSRIQTLEERLEEKINEAVRLVKENESLRQQLHTERENRRNERNHDAAEFERRRRRLVDIVKQNTELVINRMVESANTQKPIPSRRAVDNHGGGQQAKRRRFNCSLSQVPQCRNCSTVFYGGLNPVNIPCTFHRHKPQPYAVWKRHTGTQGKDADCMYWPCCQVFSTRQPVGCLQLRHHDFLDPSTIEDDC